MYHPIEYEMLAKIHYDELLKEAAQNRVARLARGDAQRPIGDLISRWASRIRINFSLRPQRARRPACQEAVGC